MEASMTKTAIVFAAAAAALCGCAAQNGEGAVRQSALTTGQCFRGDDVNNFNVADRQTAYVSTRQGHVFRLDGNCFEPGTESLSVSPFRGADPRICVGDEAAVRVGQFRAPPMPCIARVSGPITDSSVSGLRARQD
jgi:hypothetical protein